MGFKHFLLNESAVYLSQRIGDILNALQELEQNSDAMGTRIMVRSTETVVNQIRRILHTSWPKENERHLKMLQKVGVGLMKAIEEKDDLSSVISTCSAEIQQILNKLGEPVNQLGTPEGKEAKDEEKPDQVSKQEGPDKQPPQPPQQPGQQSPAPAPPGATPDGAGITQPGAAPPTPGTPAPQVPGF